MNDTENEHNKTAILGHLTERLRHEERTLRNPEWSISHGVFHLVGDVATDDEFEDISEVLLAIYDVGIADCALTVEENIEQNLRWIYFENNQVMLEMLKNKLVLFRRRVQGLPAARP